MITFTSTSDAGTITWTPAPELQSELAGMPQPTLDLLQQGIGELLNKFTLLTAGTFFSPSMGPDLVKIHQNLTETARDLQVRHL
jgi:hypothetical protein